MRLRKPSKHKAVIRNSGEQVLIHVIHDLRVSCESALDAMQLQSGGDDVTSKFNRVTIYVIILLVY
jgi:hypothetical protein